MKITGFIWLDDIVQKLLWKHSVTQKEVIELFDNSPRLFFVEKGNRTGENGYVAFGQTGRKIFSRIFYLQEKSARLDFIRS